MDISIIIPMYNAEKTIERCLNSIFLQTIDKKEIICIDDCSKDETIKIVERIMQVHPEIILLKHDVNKGAGVARNLGMKQARGEFLSFVDADDIYDDVNALKKMIDVCKKDNTYVCASLMRNNINGTISEAPLYRNLFTYNRDHMVLNYRDFQNSFYHQIHIFSRKFLNDNGFKYPDLKIYEDPPFLSQVLCKAEKISFLKINSYIYTVSKGIKKLDNKQVNDMVIGLKTVIEFSLENKLDILFLNTLKGINGNYLGRIIIESIERGNVALISLLFSIDEILNKKNEQLNIVFALREYLKNFSDQIYGVGKDTRRNDDEKSIKFKMLEEKNIELNHKVDILKKTIQILSN